MSNSGGDGEILIYQSEDGKTQIDVRFEDETAWLTQMQMTELFQTTKQNISLHIKNIFEEGELVKDSVVKESLTTASDGKKYNTTYYNLDVVISVGYRVKSHRGTQFRIWATQRLKEYLVNQRKYFGVRCWIYMPQALITLLVWRHHSNFSRWCKIN